MVLSSARPIVAVTRGHPAANDEELPLVTPLTLHERIDQKLFDAIYARSLVYNTCWEDPAVDRLALTLTGRDNLLVITSAGCNVLDYALAGPASIAAVDANPRQTALLELKLAGIKTLAHADFFQIFGAGRHPHFAEIYHDCLRPALSAAARQFWDPRGAWFSARGGGFYFHGLAGTVARVFRAYLRCRPRLAGHIEALFNATTLAQQRELYDSRVAPLLWTRSLNWALSRQITLSMLGVPHPQRREVQAQHHAGVAGFVREPLTFLAHHLPFRDNYFYAVYVRGQYQPDCCPEYLKPAQFARLKAGLAARIVPHTCTVTDFLQRVRAPISRFVLLDHMDWMSSYEPQALAEEWAAIFARATPDARIIFRSAHAEPRYLDQVRLPHSGLALRDLLRFDPLRAAALTGQDRVHTYAGFHIAHVMT